MVVHSNLAHRGKSKSEPDRCGNTTVSGNVGVEPWRLAMQAPSAPATVDNAMTILSSDASMIHPKVSHCANPKCDAEFKRLGEGTLFICPSDPEITVNHLRQKVIWLCDACVHDFEEQFEPVRHTFGEVGRPHQSY